MKLKMKEVAYPYLQKDGSIVVKSYHTTTGWPGIPLLKDGEGIPVECEFEFEMPDNPTKAAIDFFDSMKEKERADMQVKIEQIEEAKQRFLALDAPQ